MILERAKFLALVGALLTVVFVILAIVYTESGVTNWYTTTIIVGSILSASMFLVSLVVIIVEEEDPFTFLDPIISRCKKMSTAEKVILFVWGGIGLMALAAPGIGDKGVFITFFVLVFVGLLAAFYPFFSDHLETRRNNREKLETAMLELEGRVTALESYQDQP